MKSSIKSTAQSCTAILSATTWLMAGSIMAADSGYRDHYYPGTETLAADEMRVVALGTGMPLLRPSQASASFLIELGNGDIFFFDLGTGAASNFPALNIPYSRANKVFTGHLHTDHIGDLHALWMGGWVAGRTEPVHVWGPSGREPEYGTAVFVENLKKTWRWDYESRVGRLPAIGGELIAHEFDYSKPSVVYEENGVKVTAFPAIHLFDGPVSFRLDWNRLSLVFSSDTNPNKWFIEYGKDADLVIHETFMTVDQLMARWGWDRNTAVNVGTWVHTSPAQAGKVFSAVGPRMAVGYHFFNDFNTAPEIEAEIRTTYDGPLTLAKDMMVWNVTSDAIKVRQVIGPQDTWPARTPQDAQKFATEKRGVTPPFSDWLEAGRLKFDENNNIVD
jgi:ribonuclease Z